LAPLASAAGAEPNAAAAGLDDGYADLAVGVPYETLASPAVDQPGAINILYGAAGGFEGTDDFWSQDSPEIEDTAEYWDHFGSALAAGDFDGDGYPDVAVGVRGQKIGDAVNAGAVHILYGTAAGLSSSRDEVWHQSKGSMEDHAEQNDYFGWTLAAGDFDGDGRDDLAVGVPQETVSQQNCGVVQILYGTDGGLDDAGNQRWYQGGGGLQGGTEIGDQFGKTLATGDFNGDGYDDLAVGVPEEDFSEPLRYAVGVVQVLYGSAAGLTATGNDWFDQDVAGIQDSSQQYDAFGWALASGDLDGDGYDDLAVGVPGQAAGGDDYAGAVHLLYGSAGGLSANRDRLLTKAEFDMPTHYDAGFGKALAAADFDGDGYDDLAVGVPDEDFLVLGPPANVGAVYVLYGAHGGLSTTDARGFQQGMGLEDEPEENDGFGEVLAAGDLNGDGYADLAVGIPHEDHTFVSGTEEDAGAVQLLYGGREGLDSEGNQFCDQGAPIRDTAEGDDRYGYALAFLPVLRHRVFLPLVPNDYEP